MSHVARRRDLRRVTITSDLIRLKRVPGLGIQAREYGTHSIRRTKASIIYKVTGNLSVVRIPLGHAKIESTDRYLGVDVEDALVSSERTEI